jgi:hypothetical protein
MGHSRGNGLVGFKTPTLDDAVRVHRAVRAGDRRGSIEKEGRGWTSQC